MKTYHRVDSQISVMCGKWERNLWLLYIENFTRIQIDIYIGIHQGTTGLGQVRVKKPDQKIKW